MHLKVFAKSSSLTKPRSPVTKWQRQYSPSHKFTNFTNLVNSTQLIKKYTEKRSFSTAAASEHLRQTKILEPNEDILKKFTEPTVEEDEAEDVEFDFPENVFVEFVDWGNRSFGIVKSVSGKRLLIKKLDARLPNGFRDGNIHKRQVLFQFPLKSEEGVVKPKLVAKPPPVATESKGAIDNLINLLQSAPVRTEGITISTSFSEPLPGKDNLDQFVEKAEALAKTVSDSEVERLWNHFLNKNFSIHDVADVLFPKKQRDEKELYAALKILRTNYIYFRSRTPLEYMCRPKEQVQILRKQYETLMNDTEVNYFISWVQAKLNSFSPGFRTREGFKPERPYINKNPKTVWDTQRLQPLIGALKRYAFTDTMKEYYDNLVYTRLLFPLGYRRGKYDSHALLTQLDAITDKDNVYRLKAEIETHFFLPHEDGHADGPLIKAQENHDVGRSAHSSRVFTIDDPSTTEVDDGLSIETMQDGTEWLHVHIADPTRLFDPHSQLDLTARGRVSSIYLPEQKVSLFPSVLATGPMSILEKERKNYTLTFSTRLSPEGEILEYNISPTYCPNVKRTNYEDVDEVLDSAARGSITTKHFDEQEATALAKMHRWAEIRNKYRAKSGYNMIHLPKPELSIKDNRIHLKLQENTSSHTLVSELMIMAGEVAAKYSAANSIPIPFRVQSAPIPNPDGVVDENPFVAAWNAIQFSNAAKASLQPLPHHGMGLESYSRTTSPIRRYTDIVTHFQLKAHLRHAELPFTQKQLSNMLPQIHLLEEELKILQMNSSRFWLLRYLDQEGPKIYNGVVLSTRMIDNQYESNVPIVDVYLLELGMKASVRVAAPHPPGSPIRLAFLNASAYAANWTPVNSNPTTYTLGQ